MEIEFVGLTSNEAKDCAIALVSLFLLERCPGATLPGAVEWRSVVSVTQRRYRFHSVDPWPAEVNRPAQ